VTPKTRRRVFTAVLVALVTLPAEVILLRAVATPDGQRAVDDWVAGLTPDALGAAANRIEDYPFSYRRPIMKALSPVGRSETWRGYLTRYRDAHGELGASGAALVAAASSALTPQALSEPTSESRASVHAVAMQIVAEWGRETADELLYYVGPKETTSAGAEPMMMRFTQYVRDQVVLIARAPNCDCAMSWGCSVYTQTCTQAFSCSVVSTWPACGWAWSDDCDGLCSSGGR
jgi:hypothetical protein